MKDVLSVSSYDPSSRIQEGNRFLLGNGHLGYRGTIEEEGAESMTGYNLVGVYDRFQDKWRESINLPNPLSLKTFVDGKEEDATSVAPSAHKASLHQSQEIFARLSSFPHYLISSQRFLSFCQDNLLACKISVCVTQEGDFSFQYGLDLDIYDINGPHFKEKKVTRYEDFLLFEGVTNEGKHLYEAVAYESSLPKESQGESRFESKARMGKGEVFELTVYSLVFEGEEDFAKEILAVKKAGFERLKEDHLNIFSPLYEHAKVRLHGDEEGEAEGNYSIYMLLILGDANRPRSIAARGVSGQTYKGAVFWDSEIFLLPFFCLQRPEVARNLVKYRILTLEGAKAKAKEYGYEGAFFAWESQEDGRDACSKWNVTDWRTGKPIRTYFNEKQIHISADVAYAYENYEKLTGDQSLLSEGGDKLLAEIAKFFLSYATYRDGQYHLDDVIGPDEYHERVNDNAFTNYMAAHALRFVIKKLSPLGKYKDLVDRISSFLEAFYLPQPNEDGVIEQFEGYFQKEDATVDEVRSRLQDPKQYWGGKDGPATPTKVIKQADVVAMLALLEGEFPLSVKKANYDYYFPKTEHGSSLSSSMYSLLASRIGEKEYAYSMYRKSSSVDLYGPQKLFAGGIYIGGSHPASEGGAYLSLLYGWGGFSIEEEGFRLSPALPEEVRGMELSILFRKKRYRIRIEKEDNNGGYSTEIKEEKA